MSELYAHPRVIDVQLKIGDDGKSFACFVQYRISPPMFVQNQARTPEDVLVKVRDQLFSMSEEEFDWYVRPGD